MRRSTYRRWRRPAAHDKEGDNKKESFFTRKSDSNPSKSTSAFFQTKLNVGQPNDKFEREADSVANQVVNSRATTKPVIQSMGISSIQRLATPAEDERLGTNDARFLRDKEIQEKPEIQRMCAECAAEEKDKVQKQADPEEEEEMVQTKSESTASSSLSSRITNTARQGKPLPSGTLKHMNTAFGVDFSQVRVHTDGTSVGMNKELGAQAFTHGKDIYFNSGRYNPDTSAGRHLLAHELTHVVQQGGGATNDASVQRSCHDGACDTCAGGQRDFWITFYFRRKATRRTMDYLRKQINETKQILKNCCLTLKADFNWTLLKGGGTFDPLVQDAAGAWSYSADATTLGTGNTFAKSRGIPVLVVDHVEDSGGGVTVTQNQTFDPAYSGRNYAVIGVNQKNPNPNCNHLAHELWHVGFGEGHDPAHGTLAACQGNDVSPEFCTGLRNVVAPVGDFPTPSGNTAVA